MGVDAKTPVSRGVAGKMKPQSYEAGLEQQIADVQAMHDNTNHADPLSEDQLKQLEGQRDSLQTTLSEFRARKATPRPIDTLARDVATGAVMRTRVGQGRKASFLVGDQPASLLGGY